MNKRYFISQFILLWLCCSVNISYACNLPPVANIGGCPKYKKMDYPVCFIGLYSTDEDGQIVDWRWYFPPGAYDIEYDPLPWKVYCKFSSQGTYTVKLEVEDDDGATGEYNCTVYVPKVDLDMTGVPDEDEVDPGGYIAVNTDDDNTNSTQDRNDNGTVDDEDDLVEITLSMEPSVNEGYIKLQASPIGEGLIKVWEDETKGTERNVLDPYDPSYAIWDLSEGPFPPSLWVEGYHVHNTKPCSGLILSYFNGYTLDSDVVKFNPVEVRLTMDGVNEDNEEFPGNYILYNKDDDDGDGVLDYDDGYNKNGIEGDEDDENIYENDLVIIYLSWVEPSNYMTGTVTFDVTSGASKVRVWENSTKGTQVSLPATFNTPGDLSKTFYVEGIEESSGPRDVTIKLTYTKQGLTFEDKIKVTVVHVELYRDAEYTQLLDDWAKVPGEDLLRSPKYMFGEDDPIYVQVKNIGIDPSNIENISSAVAVKSQSSSEYIYLTLQETGVDTEIFRNSEAAGELLYLSTSSSEGDGDKIKVVDEEVLNFWLKFPPRDGGIYKRSMDVMLDRGEFLAIAGSETSELSNWLTSSVPYFNQNISDAKTKMQNNYKWWQNGYMKGIYYSKNVFGPSDLNYELSKEIAFNAGADLYSSCADFLFCSSHGDEGHLVIILTLNDGYVMWDPYATSSGSGWSEDVEFCLLSACQVLGTDSDPDKLVNVWINNFFPKGIHAVLATSDEVTNEAIDDDFGGFLDRLKNGETAVNAYKNACYGLLFDTRYGILVREENLIDYVLTPVASAESTLSRDYTTIDNTFYYFYYDGNQQIINPVRGGQHNPDSNRYYNIKHKIAEAIEFEDEIQIDILSLDEGEPALIIPEDVNSLFEHYRIEMFSFSGWNKIADTSVVRHNMKISEVSGRINLEPLGLKIPSDYVLDSRGKMMVSKYNANPGGMYQLGETWCEGETFEFMREHNGCKIFNDRFRIAIQNNTIISCSLTRHPLKKTGASIIKKPHFRSKDSSIKWDDLHPSLVYRVKDKAVVPFWQVQYDNYIFHYDIEQVSNMR